MNGMQSEGRVTVANTVRRIILGFVLVAGLAPAAQAAVYKCTQGGKTTFSDVPCEAGGAPIRGKAGEAVREGNDESPKGLGVQTCGRDADLRYGAMGRVEIISVSGGQMEVVSYAGTTLPARRFVVTARVWSSASDSSGRDASFTCITSEDGRRVLKDAKPEGASARSGRDAAITAPQRDAGLSESRERNRPKSIRDKETDDLY